MDDPRSAMFLQSLRGNQAVVVMAYLLLRRALTIEELQMTTGIHKDTVRTAVRGLASKGLLHSQRGAHGLETWYPVAQTFFGELAQSLKFSDSGELVSSSSNTLVLNASNLEEQEEEAQSLKFSDSGEDAPVVSEGQFRANVAACDAVGIRRPKSEVISRLAHVSPEYIRGHAKKARANGCEVGTAIYRIQNGWHLEEEYLQEKKAFSWMCPKCQRPITQCECESEEQ